MAYSAEVVRRARQRLSQAKADRESENLQHLHTAYAQVPRLQEIDKLMQQTMVEAARAAFSQGGDVNELMQQAKQKNLALQQEREALAALHFEEGYLDDSPICERCGGSGYLGSHMCECLQELCRQEQRKELNFLSGSKETFSQFRLDYYSDTYDSRYGASPRQIMERNFRNCRSYAATFTRDSGNLLFIGGPGLGKTFLSGCIAKTVADRGYSAVYETAAHLFSNLEQARFNGDENARREAAKYNNCDLLILDDLGTEMPTQFVTAALYSLLDDRLRANKPMVISTNLNVEELSRRYSPQIASRLRGSFLLMTFVGDDIRVMKNRG